MPDRLDSKSVRNDRLYERLPQFSLGVPFSLPTIPELGGDELRAQAGLRSYDVCNTSGCSARLLPAREGRSTPAQITKDNKVDYETLYRNINKLKFLILYLLATIGPSGNK